MLCTIRKEQKQNLGTKAEPSWWRSVLPSPAGSSSSLKYELFLCRRPASQGRGEGMLACLMQAGRELGRVSHFLSDLAGMMQDEPAFHVTVKSPVQFSVWKAAVGLQPRDGTFGTRYQRSSEPTPWHHTPVRHSCEGVLCSSPKRFPRNVWVLGMSFMLPYLHLKQCSLRMWRIASTPGVCSLKEHFSTYHVDRQVGFGNNP